MEIFWNLLSGMAEYEREWKAQRNRRDLTADEEQIMEILEECLKIVGRLRQDYLVLKDEFQQYMRSQSVISAENDQTFHELESENSRLIK